MHSFKEVLQTKTDQELLKMVYEFDKWSPEMLTAIEDELSKKNLLPNDLAIQKKELRDREDVALSQGKEAGALGLLVGWLTVFGFIGIAIGYNYAFSKVISKYTNKSYFKYDIASRQKGTYLFYTSITLSIIALLYKIMIANNFGL